MARFYASIQGNGQATERMGTTNSGIRAHARGWDVGARIVVYTNENGDDEVVVYRTGGSTGRNSDRQIARFTASNA